MELVIIYGPPAVGKLTVAEGLASATGYKLFHNHLTVDLLKNVLEFGTKEFFELNQKMKLDILEAAAKQEVKGIVHTFVYDKRTDDPFIAKIQEICDKYGASIRFIQLYCERDELLERVIEGSRKKFKKVSSKEALERYLAGGDFLCPIEGVNSTKIDSTRLTAEETVEQIKHALRLPK